MTDKQLAILLKKYEYLLISAINELEETFKRVAYEDGVEYNHNDKAWIYELFWAVVEAISDDYHLLINHDKVEYL